MSGGANSTIKSGTWQIKKKKGKKSTFFYSTVLTFSMNFYADG